MLSEVISPHLAAGRNPALAGARRFYAGVAAVTLGIFFAFHWVGSEYLWFSSYVVLQYVVLATAWNILGGYAGYVNFGSAAFFAVGSYTTVLLYKLGIPSLPLMILAAGCVSGLLGLGMGYLTLRLRGAYFSIATLCLAVLLQTIITNWDFLGGSRGAYIIRPDVSGFFASYVEVLFAVILGLAAGSVCLARIIEKSKLGYGLAAIRDDEIAAEASGVPTLRLKLVATTVSGALMGMAGAPMPYYATFVEPASAFGLSYAVNAMAMPLIGGLKTWLGPVIGALILGSVQQVATVTISSALNLLLVGLLLIAFLILAPQGIMGLLRRRGGRPS